MCMFISVIFIVFRISFCLSLSVSNVFISLDLLCSYCFLCFYWRWPQVVYIHNIYMIERLIYIYPFSFQLQGTIPDEIQIRNGN